MASWIVLFLAISFAAMVAVFVRYVGKVLRALLRERDPEQRRILQQVLRDLLELFRPGKHR
jgi:hypothetical protein